MKMVKSLLLGSAAGFVAVAGAQAADLPVKAKPVEYVKVCSLYGAGYYYIPGTDICMKIGGYVRQEWSYGYGGNMTLGQWNGPDGRNTDALGDGTRDTVWRTRAYISQETRQQTAYGTLRTYLTVGVNGNNSADFSSNRAFIQIAGFTVGLASSYFDHYSVAAIGYLVDSSSDTGDGGRAVFAYTAQLGNGVSASLSLEEPESKRRSIGTVNLDTPANFAIGSGTLNGEGYGKSIVPDIVANLRVDQAWGSAQIMGALHQLNASYYIPAADGTLNSLTGTNSGQPSDDWGWAVGAGIKINMPMIAPGDYIAAQVAYSEGATRYVYNTAPNNPVGYQGGDQVGYGLTTDAVMAGGLAAAGSDLQLTTSWGVAAGWEHFWTPSLRTSIHGSYFEVKYNGTANAAMCDAQTVTPKDFTKAPGVLIYGSAADCNNDWSEWQVGSRTQWNVTKDFYMGFDVVYYKLNTASKGAVVTATQAGAQPAALRTLDDQDAVAMRVRWHRDIVP
jgi:hypothetical protein